MTVWPVDLPQAFLAEAVQVVDKDALIRSEVDVGLSQTRPRFTRNMEMIEGEMRMTSAQWDSFITFYRTTLAKGSLPFTWVHPFTGDAVTLRFKQPPTSQADGKFIRVSMSLETQ